ncbi:MAG TPA: DEAD/DEAH box helicase [Desulfobacteria bacterium]|nr:DEAD/DEAH box helicase [Desulfobacteria bacterium]
MEQYYHGLKLDPFQQEAIQAINEGASVVVAAPTGTGKTLVADYLVEKTIQSGRRIVYTAPIKALSNQKYKDFKHTFGEDLIGIMTGDIVINPTAPVLIMTTEIFRNQVITDDPGLDKISYLILDEIHWLNDEDRGTVWEESIILAPPGIKLLGLSATIANSGQLVRWMSAVRGEPVRLIEEQQRAVPLEYYYFTKETGPVDLERLWEYYRGLRTKNGLAEKNQPIESSTHLDLIKAIKSQYLPTLYFVFSRKQCALKARELALHHNFLRSADKRRVESLFLAQFGPEDTWSASTRLLRRLCTKGIAFHHAGLLPGQKSVVEDLFASRLIQVLYCTETFSVGINFPVKSVCFDALEKFDGRQFRGLANHEFFQMSGRAGRRGTDSVGYSFALVDLNYMEKTPPPMFDLSKLEPLNSQFKLSYNSVLNLSQSLDDSKIATYFERSFAAYIDTERTESLRNELADLEKQFTTINAEVCPEITSFICPLKYRPKSRELARLKRAFGRLGARGQQKIYGRQMAKKIKQLTKHLSLSPKDCHVEQINRCRELIKPHHRHELAIGELRKRLTAPPAKETFLRDYYDKLAHLEQLGYLRERTLLARGVCASRIYVQELLVTELIFSDIFASLSDDQLNALLACVDFEARKNDYFNRAHVLDMTPVLDIIKYLERVCGEGVCRFDHRVAPLAYAWSQGSPFTDVQKLCNLDEGDIISVFRRTIDLLRQMRDAVTDPDLKARLKDCMQKLDRDEAAIDL